jgi:UDP-glucose 4-epimerase
MSRRVLITGASGALGRALAGRLAAEPGASIAGLVRAEPSAPIPGFTRLVVGDLRSPASWPSLEGVSVVFHLAAFVHRRPRSDEDRREVWAVNRDATRRLAEACAEARALLVFASTVAVYGRLAPGSRPNEDTAAEPTTDYGRSKLEAEGVLRATPGLDWVALRFPLLFGPWGRGNMERLLGAVARGRFWPLGGAGVEKSLLSFDDAALALDLASRTAEARGQVFVVAPPRPVTLREIQRAAYSATGRRAPPVSCPRGVARGAAAAADVVARLLGRKASAVDAVATLFAPAAFDGRRFASVTGFVPAEGIDQGLARTAEWLKSGTGVRS